MLPRLSALLVAVGAVVALNGCGDPTAIDAQLDNVEAHVSVFALNGTPSTLPSAFHVQTSSVRRVDATFNFDLAFDLNPAGEVLVHSVRHVASQVIPATHRVGVRFTDQPFDQVVEAPRVGYDYDSTFVFPVGQTMIIDVLEITCGGAILGPNIRGKAAIDSVNLSQRKIFLRVLSNRNCGFRSLAPGRPKD
jgi:hypothetical protein